MVWEYKILRRKERRKYVAIVNMKKKPSQITRM